MPRFFISSVASLLGDTAMHVNTQVLQHVSPRAFCASRPERNRVAFGQYVAANSKLQEQSWTQTYAWRRNSWSMRRNRHEFEIERHKSVNRTEHETPRTQMPSHAHNVPPCNPLVHDKAQRLKRMILHVRTSRRSASQGSTCQNNERVCVYFTAVGFTRISV